MGGVRKIIDGNPGIFRKVPKLKTPEEGKALGAAMAEQKKDPAAFRKKYAKKNKQSMLDEEQATTLG